MRTEDLARADDLERIFVDAAQTFASFEGEAFGPGNPVGPVPQRAVVDHLPKFIDHHDSSAGAAGAMGSGKYLHFLPKALAGEKQFQTETESFSLR